MCFKFLIIFQFQFLVLLFSCISVSVLQHFLVSVLVSVLTFSSLYLSFYKFFSFYLSSNPKHLTLWTPEDGIPTICKLPYAAGLLYTVQTARYHTRRQTVYLRYGA